MDSSLPYILTGFIFYCFGLKWCYEYAKYWISCPNVGQKSTNSLTFVQQCKGFLANHPMEGSLKLIATVIGLTSTLSSFTDVPRTSISPTVVHVTIYLFFAFSGLIDVLNFYFPRNVSDGLVKLALGQSFFVEGFLFVWTKIGDDYMVSYLLALVVWTTAFAVCLEIIWPETKLLRATTTLLQGSWVAHMVRMEHVSSFRNETIALSFTWHIAAASVVTLCMVSIVRSCTPQVTNEEPPEVPIYDYCQETEHRM